jgi:uncharacterized protein DUF5989
MNEPDTLQEAAKQPAPSLTSEFFAFLLHNKKWWLVPVLIVMALLTVLMLVSSTPVAPFIYTLF